ncbi:MAG: tetratricopeptide repeat-containing sensor histidine kinase [Bacteroidia bacterium]
MKTLFLRFLFYLVLAGWTVPLVWSQQADPLGKATIAAMVTRADSLLPFVPDSAMALAEMALANAERGGMPDLKADAEMVLARAFMNKGYYNRGLNAGFNALRYYESVRDTGAMGEAKHRIATIYLETNNTVLSKSYEREALALLLLEPKKDTLALFWTYLGLGNHMDRADVLDSALHYYFTALDLAKAVNNSRALHCCHNNIALIYRQKKDFDKALAHFQEGIAITRAIQNYSATAFMLDNIGDTYFQMGQPEEALRYSEEAYGMALERQSASGLVNIHSHLAQAYAATGKWEKAYFHQHAYTELVESYFNERNSSSMADMEGKYQNDKKQAEIALLNKDNEYKALQIDRQSTIQNLLIGGLVLLLLLVILAVVAYLDKQKTNRLLHDQQEQIKRINSGLEEKVRERTQALEIANKELNDLLYRTSHDLRSPITKIMGLLSLARAEAMPTDTVLEHIGRTMEGLDAQNLSICELGAVRHHVPAPASLDLRGTLEEVLTEVKTRMGEDAAEVKLEVAAGTACVLDSYLLKIAVREIVANAFAYGGAPQAKVRIAARKEGNHVRIAIEDQGPGIPAGIRHTLFDLFVKGNNSPEHFGLGLYKARLAVQRMGGRVSYRSEVGAGTVFEIEVRSGE